MDITPPLTAGSRPVSVDDLATLAREKRPAPQLVAHLAEVITAGGREGEFWCSSHSRWSRVVAYALPSAGEISALLTRVSEQTMVLFPKAVDPAGRDSDSLVNNLEVGGLATFADALLHFPREMFRDALWRSVARVFKGTGWHAYLHGSKAVAFSTQDNARKLFGALVRPGTGRWEPAFDSPILVSDRDDAAELPREYDTRPKVAAWFGFKRDECSSDVWKTCEELRVVETYSSAPAEALAKRFSGHPDGLAELLSRGVEQLW